MNCAKVLLSCFEGNLRHKKLNLIKNFEIAFSCASVKVKPFSKFSVMEDLYDPPSSVRGMKILDRNAFKKTITVPCLTGECKQIGKLGNILKKYSLKIFGLKSLQKMENDTFRVLLDSKVISSWNDFDKSTLEHLEKLNIRQDNFSEVSIELGYENWNSESTLKAILPKDVPPLTSFSKIGHIVHLNIKEELLDYKKVMGEVLLDKTTNCRTVICKQNIINNVYRNFEMELLSGEPDYIATVNSYGCQFELDFSKVYWNPRLGAEHMRIVNEVNDKDVLFDVFAGIGPFSIPAAKKNCVVYANDLNPESVKWLKHNIKLNKKAKDNITVFNKDGKDFILNDIKETLVKIWQDALFCYKIHVVMNLPAIAPTFLKYFNKLISESDLADTDVNQVKKCLPIINCYFFAKHNQCEKTVFEESSEMNLDKVEHSFHYVRTVATGKNMFRVTFRLPFEYLVGQEEGVDRVVETGEPLSKRICTK